MNCLDCNKELSKQSPCKITLRCRSCAKKGVLNPSYTDGNRTKNKFCIDCNKIISKSSRKYSRCLSCKWKQENSGINNPMYGKRGKLSPAYVDGSTKLKSLIRGLYEYRQWRSDVFTRDSFTCQSCFIKGGELNAHHIKPFYKIFEDNNIKSLKDAMQCEELWNINNGVTLCIECHKKTNSFLNSMGKNQHV